MSAPGVTLLDRDAASALGARLGVPDITGPRNQEEIAEAFARHRLATEAEFAAREAALVEALEAILKTMDGYRSQMKFCDVEALSYFREFDQRIERSGFRAVLARAHTTSEGEG